MKTILGFIGVCTLAYVGQELLGVHFSDNLSEWWGQFVGLVLVQLSGMLIAEL